jgi:hypothetical protein
LARNDAARIVGTNGTDGSGAQAVPSVVGRVPGLQEKRARFLGIEGIFSDQTRFSIQSIGANLESLWRDCLASGTVRQDASTSSNAGP